MKEVERKEEEGHPFWPHHVLNQFIIFYLVIGILLALLALLPPELKSKADPFTTPEHIKPEWYFLWMYEVLRLMPEHFPAKALPLLSGKTVAIVGQGALVLVFVFWPFLDRGDRKRARERRILTPLVLLGIMVIVILSYLGKR
jgi:quinol-cytochrome oxidoreductase complex cytochrome b subunit